MYQLKIRYTTGNTFGKHEDITILKHSFDDYLEAAEAAKRIREHHDWYNSISSIWKEDLPKPTWLKEYKYDCQLNILVNNKEETISSSIWCGYFETLNEISIIER